MKHLLFAFIILCTTSLLSQEVTKKSKFDGIPEKLEWVIEPKSFKISNDTISITAGANTNMFYAPHGNFNVSNMPKLLFEPDHNFEFSAKAYAEHKSKWEAAMLVVYVNENYWAKFCFENESAGKNRMVTVVTNKVSDDAYSDYVSGNSVYMKISKEGKQIVFSYSVDNINWIAIRYFRMDTDDEIKIGFASQSPIGEGLISVFTQINYSE